MALENYHKFDAVIVGYPGHFDVPRARRVAGKRPLIFNPLVSLPDSNYTRQALEKLEFFVAIDFLAAFLAGFLAAFLDGATKQKFLDEVDSFFEQQP